MKTTIYLSVNSRGSARVYKTRPALNYDEVEIALNLVLPDSLFEKPRLQAKVQVPDDAVSPQNIEVEVVENIKEAIRTAAGMPVEITLVRPEESK